MAKRDNTPRERKLSPSDLPRPDVIVEDGVAPLYAIHKITYGDDQAAPSKSIFTPVSEDERNELLGLGAARELTAEEAALLGLQAAPAAPEGDPAASDSDVIE
jgi:hypothetical protein